MSTWFPPLPGDQPNERDLEALARAWDDGYVAAMDDAWKSEMAEPHRNPYRERAEQ